jgi:hypothetical protein
MMHNPSGGGDSKKDKEVLGILKNSLVDSFVARTGKEGKIISDLMDVETWVEARMVNGVSAMVEMGLADKIFQSSVKISPTAQIFNAQKLYSFSNNILKQDDMEHQRIEDLSKQLGDLSKVVDALKKEKDEKEEEIKILKKSIEDKDKVLKEASDKAAVELIENAIASGKIKKEVRETMIENAKNSFSIVKDSLDAMPVTHAARFTNVAGVAGSTKAGEGKEGWNIRDYEEKDPEALAEIFRNEKDKYQEMYNAYYK